MTGAGHDRPGAACLSDAIAVPALARLGGTSGASRSCALTTRRRFRRSGARRGSSRHSARSVRPAGGRGRRARLPAGSPPSCAFRSAAASPRLGAQGAAAASRADRSAGSQAHRRPADRRRIHWANLADDQVVDGVTTPAADGPRLRAHAAVRRGARHRRLRAPVRARRRARSSTAIDVRGAGARRRPPGAALRRPPRGQPVRVGPPGALHRGRVSVVEPQAAVDLRTGIVHPDLVCRVLRAGAGGRLVDVPRRPAGPTGATARATTC